MFIYLFLARLDEVQKSLCTTPGVGVGVGVSVSVGVGVGVSVHIYVKVFSMAYIFQITWWIWFIFGMLIDIGPIYPAMAYKSHRVKN